MKKWIDVELGDISEAELMLECLHVGYMDFAGKIRDLEWTAIDPAPEPVAQLAFGEQDRDPRDGPRVISWNEMPAGTYALYAHPPVKEVVGELTQQLFYFYDVDSLEALIEAQDKHIEKLQAKLPQTKDEFPRTPRA
jgi:hypothetical protein